ncbi:amino acid ABC transporter [Georhizobium profundi]|uniref:Amino acid ABC transporter n=1 Tax=Georhizobium profundi TaxID=2341112 RepID=A0A3S9B1K6_9HYPH|nr:transporter substrate-binding domain-containing protein [Georhizobium profundi]AZN70782.1 amino acid ABC transporter [Georhizobium profundi]
MLARHQNKTSLALYGLIVFLLCLIGLPSGSAWGQTVKVPNVFDPRERLALPDLSGAGRVRFLMTTDFPPFSFLDQSGRLAGFHVDLARVLCGELDIEPRCQVQALPWDELEPALAAGEGEVIMAGLQVSEESRERYLFTRTIMDLPARFVVKAAEAGTDRVAADHFELGARIGVIQRSAHAAMLQRFFPDLTPVPFASSTMLYRAVQGGWVDGIFADGLQLSFWLGSPASAECCGFLDGPFLSREFLGNGLSIAVRNDLPQLVEGLDYALMSLNKSGRFAELYLRYFPNGLY